MPKCERCGLNECVCEETKVREVQLGGSTFRLRPFRGVELLRAHGLAPGLASAVEFRSMQSAYRAWSDHVAVLGAGCFQLAQISELVKGGAPEEAVFPYALELYLRACFETAIAMSQDGTDSGVDTFVFDELSRLGVDGQALWDAAERGRVRSRPLHREDCGQREGGACTCDTRLLVVKAKAVPLDRWEAFRAWEARQSS